MTTEKSKMEILVAALQHRTPPGEILWRPGAMRGDKSKVQIMAYIDGIYVERVLDAAVGVFGWQRRHRMEGDTYICGIGIKDPETGEWIWKEDGAGATDFEGQKGGLTDSFKRAARTGWGIGRDLVDIGERWVECIPAERGKRPGLGWEYFKSKQGEFHFKRPVGAKAGAVDPDADDATPETVSPGKPEQQGQQKLLEPEEKSTAKAESTGTTPVKSGTTQEAKQQIQQRQQPAKSEQVKPVKPWGDLMTKAAQLGGGANAANELLTKVKALRETVIHGTLPEEDAWKKAEDAIAAKETQPA
jgi:hypothetical protein